MTIKAIRDDDVFEEINPEHIVRVWEEGEFTAGMDDGLPEGKHKYTHVMFTCGLVVRYKGFVQKS